MVRFPETRHSALAAVRSGDADARRRGLDVLAESYWRPVYGYLRLRWRKPHAEAADLTQDFFALLLENGALEKFDPSRARLRTYLRACADGLASNDRRAARRRGQPVSFDFESARAEVEARAEPAASPEALFEKEWARGLFTAALGRLRERCAKIGKEQHFQIFHAYELGDRPSYAELARRFQVSVSDVTNRLAWARRELRAEVLRLLRESTAGESEFRAEARALLGIDPP